MSHDPLPLGGGWEVSRANRAEAEFLRAAEEGTEPPACRRLKVAYVMHSERPMVLGILYRRRWRLAHHYEGEDHVN